MNEYDANLWTLETVFWFLACVAIIGFALGGLIAWSHAKVLERILDYLPVREE